VTPAPNVLLLSMPWAPVYEPSLGLAILKSCLGHEGIRTRVRHCALFLLEYLKYDSYDALGGRWGINDFLFTEAFEGQTLSPDQTEALRHFFHNDYRVVALRARQRLDEQPFLEYILKVRNEAIPQFLQDCMRVVRQTRPTMVGFTCMFDQTIASLALAKIIKEEFRDTLVVFGGYAIEDPVGAHLAEFRRLT
jgi:hypothetical protein